MENPDVNLMIDYLLPQMPQQWWQFSDLIGKLSGI